MAPSMCALACSRHPTIKLACPFRLLSDLPRRACKRHWVRIPERFADALRERAAWQRHLIDVIIDQMKAIQRVPLQLPNLLDPRTVRVAQALMTYPGNRQPLAQICRESGANGRTVERLFRDETGMTLGKWRQQLRLMQAMRLLGEGAKVTHAALESGHGTPIAFIAAFRKSPGTTPIQYFKMSAKER
jgi:AraC-like DNA-binding protein